MRKRKFIYSNKFSNVHNSKNEAELLNESCLKGINLENNYSKSLEEDKKEIDNSKDKL